MNEHEAERQGLNVRFWDFLFYVSFGFVVTSSVAIAGVLLVFCFLIVPSVTAMLFATASARVWRSAGRWERSSPPGRVSLVPLGPADRRDDRGDLRRRPRAAFVRPLGDGPATRDGLAASKTNIPTAP